MSKPKREVSDEAAADALRNGSQFGPMPTHDAMQTADEDTDAEDFDEGDLEAEDREDD